MKYKKTRLARIKGKVCIITNEPEDTVGARAMRRRLLSFVPLCERGRVCSGINCPCHPTKHLGVAPSTE